MFYPDRISARPGDEVGIHASSPSSPCELVVSRVAKERDEVVRISDLAVDSHPIPESADSTGCGWPRAFSIRIDETWQPGYYDLELVGPSGGSSHHFICVKRRVETTAPKAVLVLATNTYAAYNYWGGSNAYADVEAMQAGELSAEQAAKGAIGRLSRMRPLAQSMFAPPPGSPRLVNPRIRDMGEFILPGDPSWMREHKPSTFDGAAGYVDKWEHRFVAWAEDVGYELDYLTDQDFESEPKALAAYAVAIVVGHSEYWSGAQRKAIQEFVIAGGNLAVFSGNTGYWKVRWEDEGDTLVAHKWRGEVDDPLWGDPSTRADATHLWSHPAFQSPEAELLGLSFLYGGYHRLCMCVARGAGAYTIYDDEHWALEGTDLFYGDQLGSNVPLLGYENDGCPIRFGEDGLPKSDGGLGVPADLQIIALAPATLIESPRNPFPAVIPEAEAETQARIAFGSDSRDVVKRLLRGHAVMASHRLGSGEVFNAGTTEWAHGLAARDPFVTRITMNVLDRFGAVRGYTATDPRADA